MIEIYLFVNPLDRRSVEAEEALLAFSNDSTEKINLTILPIVNQKSVTAALAFQRIPLEVRNTYMNLAYKMALDFKAAQIQGKKIAREFLLTVQYEILATKQPYCESLVEKFFTKHGDYPMFLEDRSSELVKELFWNDQQTARNFHISCETSAVVYNCTHEGAGLLIKGSEKIQQIPQLNYLQPHCPLNALKQKNKAYN